MRAARALASALTALFALPATAQERGGRREAATLELLRDIPHVHGRLYSATVGRTTNDFGYDLVTPRFQGCGVGWNPPFDPDLARRLARRLCAIYGLRPAADAPAPQQVAATLDSFDAERGIGVELRGVVHVHPETGWPSVVAEPAERDLDATEHAALRTAGVRVHTADVASYWSAGSRDEMTTTLTYLAGVAAFLNDVTDGEDVDWDALMPFGGRWLDVPRPARKRGMRLEHFGGGSNVKVERAVQFDLAVDPATAWVSPDEKNPVVPNTGRPVIVQMFGLVSLRGRLRVELWQRAPDGEPRRLAASDNQMLFAPGSFDATQPFSVRLRLEPGEHRVSTMCWISGAEPR